MYYSFTWLGLIKATLIIMTMIKSVCIGSCSVRRSRSDIVLIDHLLTEQDPIHRLYICNDDIKFTCKNQDQIDSENSPIYGHH